MLVDFATRLTAAKRHILEDPDLYVVETAEGVKVLNEISDKLVSTHSTHLHIYKIFIITTNQY